MNAALAPPIYVLKGKKIDRKKFDQLFHDNETLVIAGGGAFEQGALHLYLTDDDLAADLRGTPGGEAVATAREGARKLLKDEAKEPEKALIARYEKESRLATQKYLRLSKETGLSHDSPQLLQKAIDAGIINSGILYDNVNYGGAWKLVGKGNLSWIGFNDRASSFKMIASVGFLAEKANFFGRKYWFFGTYFFEPNLGTANFDNIASSVWM